MPATRETKQGKPTYKEKKFCEYLVQYREEKRQLPERQAIFASYHIRDGDTSTADSIAFENLSKPRVTQEIERLEANLDKNFTQEKYQLLLLDLANKTQTDTAKAKYLELYGKSRAFLTEKREVSNKQSFETSKELGKVETKDLILELEQRLKLSSQGINTSDNVPQVGNNK